MNQTHQNLSRYTEARIEILRTFGIQDTSLDIEDCTEYQWCAHDSDEITFGSMLMDPDNVYVYSAMVRRGAVRHEVDGFVAFIADDDNGGPIKLYVFDSALECVEEYSDDSDEVKYRLKAG